MKAHSKIQRRLSAELHYDAFGLLNVHDVHHVLERQRLEVETVRCVVIGRDSFGIAVDHDCLKACVAQSERGVTAAVVELNSLPYAIRARA